MRILYVNDALIIWGGLERILVEKMNYLADTYGYDVHMVTVDQGSHPIPFPLSPNVHLQDLNVLFQQQYRYKGLKRWLMRWRLQRSFNAELKKFVDKIRPDVLICVRMHLLPTMMRVANGIPVIVESHSLCKSYLYDHDRLLQRLKVRYQRWFVRKAQMVVALTEGDASEWKNLNKNVCSIPNIVHLNETGRYSDCSAKRVIFVGRFSRQKDIGSLTKIWVRVHNVHPDWELCIFAGHGELYEECMALLGEAGDLNISVHEPTLDIFEQYQNSSILLSTSEYEPFGLVLPEAMSCGLPVVAFDCPYGPADIISDGVDGFLIKDRNIDVYVEKLCMLMDDQQLRQTMGEAGIRSSRRYEADRIMPQWKRLLEDLPKKDCLN